MMMQNQRVGNALLRGTRFAEDVAEVPFCEAACRAVRIRRRRQNHRFPEKSCFSKQWQFLAIQMKMLSIREIKDDPQRREIIPFPQKQ